MRCSIHEIHCELQKKKNVHRFLIRSAVQLSLVLGQYSQTYEKKVHSVMVNNSININKMYNYPPTSNHGTLKGYDKCRLKKGFCLGTFTQMGEGVNRIMESQPSPLHKETSNLPIFTITKKHIVFAITAMRANININSTIARPVNVCSKAEQVELVR